MSRKANRLYSAAMGDAWITGIGLVTALGGDRETSWNRLIAGESGIAALTLFDPTGFRTSIAAQVDDASLPVLSLPHISWRRISRASRFAITAMAEALIDAGIPLEEDENRPWPLVLGGGTAGLFETEGFVARRLRQGPRARGLSEFIETMQDSVTDRVAQAFGLTGTRMTITTACSSATIAVGMAAELVRDGDADIVIAGGSDALCHLTYAGFNSLRAVDTEPCKPFDIRRKGLSLGEGSAILIIESAERARRRGARPYAKVLGYGATNDAFHMTQPEPSGTAWERTILAALTNANVVPADVDYVNAHGTATEQNDAAESAAYQRVFADRLDRLPISSIKGAVGHCLCAAGGVEAAITALAIARQIVPPTAGFAQADPACPVDPVAGKGRSQKVGVAISSSFAFGGNSGVVVLSRCS